MNRFGWISLAVVIIYLALQFAYITYDQVNLLISLNSANELNAFRLKLWFSHSWLFVAPTLILLSLYGLVKRKYLGYYASLLYVDFIIVYGLLHYLTPVDHNKNFWFGHLIINLVLLTLLNLPQTVRLFKLNNSKKAQVIANFSALATVLILITILLILTTNN
jgi:hypothetical protein